MKWVVITYVADDVATVIGPFDSEEAAQEYIENSLPADDWYTVKKLVTP